MRFSTNIQLIPFPHCFKLLWPTFPTGDGQSDREGALQANSIFQIHRCFPKSAIREYGFLSFHPTPTTSLWETSCFRNGPTVGPIIRWGLSQEERSCFVQAGEKSGLRVFKFCTQPTSLVVIAASRCKNRRRVVSVLPSPEQKSLSDLNLRGL